MPLPTLRETHLAVWAWSCVQPKLGLDVLGFDRRDVVIEGPVPSSLEEGTDDDEAADGDR